MRSRTVQPIQRRANKRDDREEKEAEKEKIGTGQNIYQRKYTIF